MRSGGDAGPLLYFGKEKPMHVIKYEARLDDDGFVTLNTVFSKYIPGIENHFKTQREVYELCQALKMDSYSEEHVFLLCFGGRNMLKGFFEIGIGNIDTCIVDVRGIAQKVLLLNAHYMILIHNHPSGDPTPSELDYMASNKLKQLGKLLEIPFEDSIILGTDTYISFKEDALL